MATDDLKQSNAGMVGGTNGSLGGASSADLDRGFMTEEPVVASNEWDAMLNEPSLKGGFVGRPTGWDR